MPFEARKYIEQEGLEFDVRLLTVRVADTVCLDGLWQSEQYFKDIESTIRREFRIIPPADESNFRIAEDIRNTNSVAIHIRWFDRPNNLDGNNVGRDYYSRAIELIEESVNSPTYFVFSDDPGAARQKLQVPEGRAVFVSQDLTNNAAIADLWLMTLCKSFIIANSTFSWWGAWLANERGKIVICPKNEILNGKTAWNFAGQIPAGWLCI
jgi:hypothetical protein